MTLELDVLSIPTTHKDFRAWMDGVPEALQEFDAKNDEIWTQYFRDGNDTARDEALLSLKMDVLGLKYALEAVWALWRQLRDEMD